MSPPRHVAVIQGHGAGGTGLQVPFDIATQVSLAEARRLVVEDPSEFAGADLVVVDAADDDDLGWVPDLVARLAACAPGTPVAVTVPWRDVEPVPAATASPKPTGDVPVHVTNVEALGDDLAVVFEPGGTMTAKTLVAHLDVVVRARARLRTATTPDPVVVADSERHLLAQLAAATSQLEQDRAPVGGPDTVGRRAGRAIDRAVDVARYTRNRLERDGVGPTVRWLGTRARSAVRGNGDRSEGT